MCVCLFVSRCTGLIDDRHPGVSAGERPEVHLFMPGKQSTYNWIYNCCFEVMVSFVDALMKTNVPLTQHCPYRNLQQHL